MRYGCVVFPVSSAQPSCCILIIIPPTIISQTSARTAVHRQQTCMQRLMMFTECKSLRRHLLVPSPCRKFLLFYGSLPVCLSVSKGFADMFPKFRWTQIPLQILSQCDTASRYISEYQGESFSQIMILSIVLSILKSSNIVYMSVHRELSVIRTPRSINPNNTGGTGGHGQISLITFFISVQMMLNCIMRQC